MIKILIIIYASMMTYVSYVTTDGSLKVTYEIVRDGVMEAVDEIRSSI